MLTMRDHGVEDYEALRHMDTTDVGELSDDDRACLEDLGQYLVSTDAWRRFGIWLLHKHFEPQPGEVFVERAIRSPRRTETAPVMRSAFAEQGLSTTAIRFDESISTGVGVIGMEFAEPDDYGDTEPLSEDDEIVLGGIAERLQAHDKTQRFGVRLIRNPLELSDAELLHETCDSATRTLHCTVGERDAMLADQHVIQTAWKWRVVQGGSDATVMQDCTAGCVRVGEGHDVAHTASGTDDFDNPTTGEPNEPF
jgi:hypothetical protein